MTRADGQDEPVRPGRVPGDLAGAWLPRDGLSWSTEVDLEALLAAVSDAPAWGSASGRSPGQPTAAAPACEDADAELAEYLEAVEAGRSRVIPLPVVAGRIAESVPTGPELAGWLAAGAVTGLEDGALAGMAASYRRLASWAQAGELAVVAEVASRSAAADDRIEVDEQGRPETLPREACAEISLALVMSQATASWWTDLGVTLRWRLAATGAALAAGSIDLGRARAIAEATALLDDETARAVEARLLAGAGAKTMAGLRATLRRAVIAADPQGAERRREEAERRAKVVLYPDAEGTASLAGYSLPGIHAAAAMARIGALAQALKASGAGDGIDLLRVQVFLGLLLGTLPYIPPPADGPPGEEPPDGSQPIDDLPADATDAGEDGQDGLGARPPPTWPEVPPVLQQGPSSMGSLPPAGGGLLDLTVPWGTLTGNSPDPGSLGRLGPITPIQTRYLADLAARDPTARWRVIVTDPDGRAVAVTDVPGISGQQPQAQPRAGLVGQVTVIIGRDCLDDAQTAGADILSRVLAAARSAIQRKGDAGAAQDRCAHPEAALGYRPTRALWQYVTARDLTCRFGTCRQPATRCDLDHTSPYDQGGRTCSCNLGSLCRFHHQIKQHPGWHLAQPAPGTFTWTTRTGRTYTVQPDSHAA